ncbi:hypothetical protein R3I94_022761 [Phoxinus phoxinus]
MVFGPIRRPDTKTFPKGTPSARVCVGVFMRVGSRWITDASASSSSRLCFVRSPDRISISGYNPAPVDTDAHCHGHIPLPLNIR